MKAAVTKEGQTVIPVPTDPVAALRGSARGERLLERLLQQRREGRPQGKPMSCLAPLPPSLESDIT
jgi:tRNA A37 threonylcarbamoyladenosine synthetase subunit TsaC/SUA5/YrdC